MSAFVAKTDLVGIVASLHTPFTAAGEIDEASLARLVEHSIAAGCRGVLVSAVAGEVGALDPDERRRLLAVVAETAAGRLAIVAGVSAADLETSRDLAREAAERAQMVLWNPPAGRSEAELLVGLQTLVEAGPGQVMLQDLDWHGSGFDPGLIARLAAAEPGLTAVKIETAPAGPKYSAVARATAGRLHLSGGWAAMQMPDGLARGLDAFVPSGILPVYTRIFALWQAGQQEEARALFERALPILAFSNQQIDVSIRFWKHVRRRQGFFVTEACRPPLRSLDPVQAEEADRMAERALALEAAVGGSGTD